MAKIKTQKPGSLERVVREHRTIHLLRYGRTLCGKPGVPATWEEGHVWAGDSDREHVNCPGCLAALLPNAPGERLAQPGSLQPDCSAADCARLEKILFYLVEANKGQMPWKSHNYIERAMIEVGVMRDTRKSMTKPPNAPDQRHATTDTRTT